MPDRDIAADLDCALTAIAEIRRRIGAGEMDIVLAAIERTMDNAYALLTSK